MEHVGKFSRGTKGNKERETLSLVSPASIIIIIFFWKINWNNNKIIFVTNNSHISQWLGFVGWSNHPNDPQPTGPTRISSTSSELQPNTSTISTLHSPERFTFVSCDLRDSQKQNEGSKMGSRLGRRVINFTNLPIKLLMPSSFTNIKEIALKTVPSASKVLRFFSISFFISISVFNCQTHCISVFLSLLRSKSRGFWNHYTASKSRKFGP